MQNNLNLSKWWDVHHRGGGLVFYVPNVLDLVQSPAPYVSELYDRYRQIPFEQVLEFSESVITDNSMPNREVLEDGSKIHMLRHAHRNNDLQFNVQLLHEPWYYRWRVHPGSGRLAALWLENVKEIPGVYIYFNTERITRHWTDIGKLAHNAFAVSKPTTDSRLLATEQEFLDAIVCQKKTQPEFETYYAFPTKSKDCFKTQQMDLEWHWHYTSNQSYMEWKFLRWSEGKNFLEHKYHWRSYAIDLWQELNGQSVN